MWLVNNAISCIPVSRTPRLKRLWAGESLGNVIVSFCIAVYPVRWHVATTDRRGPIRWPRATIGRQHN